MTTNQQPNFSQIELFEESSDQDRNPLAQLQDALKKTNQDEINAAMKRVIGEYRRLIIGIGRKKGIQGDSLDDYVQEVWIKLCCTSLNDYDRELPPRRWLGRVAFNLAIDHLRASSRKSKHETAVSRDPRQGDPLQEEPWMIAGRNEMIAAMSKAIENLPEKLLTTGRLLFAARTRNEIADDLDIPRGTVNSRINRIYSTLRTELAPWCTNNRKPQANPDQDSGQK